MNKFEINGYIVDDNSPTLVFPDIGTFFNQDIELAKQMVVQLHAGGAQFIKGEILHDPDVALKDGTKETYLGLDGNEKFEFNRSLIERKVVSLSNYDLLFSFVKKLGLQFILSVYDFRGAEFACDIGASALKIASSNIVHKPLIEFVSKTNLPLIIDTGKSTLEEIARAVQWAREAKTVGVMIQHSPEAPPSPLTNHNLKMIRSLRQIFDCPTCLSDHHSGVEMLYAAVALGAHAVEKGVIPDQVNDDQDVFHALRISEFSDVLNKIRAVKLALGSDMRTNIARNSPKHPYRMGLVAKRKISRGELLSLENIRFAFPARGIPVEYWDLVQGWQVKSDIPESDIISWLNVEAVSL